MRRIVMPLLIAVAVAGCGTGKAPAPAPDSAPVSATQAAAPAPASVAELNDKAFGLIKEQKWGEATAVAKQATEAEPRNSAAWFNLGRAYLGAGQNPDAVPAFQKASDLTGGGNADVEYYLGKALEAAGRGSDAQAVFKRAVARFPDDKELRAAADSFSTDKLVGMQEAARNYLKGVSPETTSALLRAVEAYLQSPSSKSLSHHGNEMGVMAVLGDAPAPRIIRMHFGPTWVQWWPGDTPHIQLLPYSGKPAVEWAVPFTDGNRQLMAMLLGDGRLETAVLYELNAQNQQWQQVMTAFGPFAAEVGAVKVESTPQSIVAETTGMSFENGGRTLKICEKFNGPCATAEWNGQQYVRK